MLKSILNLEGAQGLSKNEQKTISGGMLVATTNLGFCFGQPLIPIPDHWCDIHPAYNRRINGQCFTCA